MFRTDLLSIIRSLNTVHAAIGICHASYVDCLLEELQFHHDLPSNIYCCVQGVETPDDGQ